MEIKDYILHGLKVILFVAISGALTGLINFLANIHPADPLYTVILAAVNGLLAMAYKKVTKASA